MGTLFICYTHLPTSVWTNPFKPCYSFKITFLNIKKSQPVDFMEFLPIFIPFNLIFFQLSKWPRRIREKLDLLIHPLVYPLPHDETEEMLNWWGRCASFRLFLPVNILFVFILLDKYWLFQVWRNCCISWPKSGKFKNV